ncbi:MAG: PPOX class F420-dependent oxidoreductase [Methanothrix sp.]|nr:MAG: PPOX class F420-dependent oxidoreductase [Methanothrix sp.]
MREDTKLEQFRNFEYIRLETIKKNGQVVPTPVWFVVEDDMLYVRSYANSGKVKRMKNNPHVRVTPSDALGKPHGVTIDGLVERANGDMEIKISQRLYRKYGLMKMSFDLWGAIKQLDWAVFAIKI